jgi:hypothetical protein
VSETSESTGDLDTILIVLLSVVDEGRSINISPSPSPSPSPSTGPGLVYRRVIDVRVLNERIDGHARGQLVEVLGELV